MGSFPPPGPVHALSRMKRALLYSLICESCMPSTSLTPLIECIQGALLFWALQ